MSRDLILANIDDNLTTLRQLSSIFVREVIAIDHRTKMEPVLQFFKRGEFQMAVVTQVVEDPSTGNDPALKKVVIVTLEDIIEELLQEEIEDERDAHETRIERRRIR